MKKKRSLFPKELIIFLLTIFFFATPNQCQDLNRREGIVINLPKPSFKSNVSVEEAILNRRSVRHHVDTPIDIQDVSQLLWAAYGITKPNITYKSLRGGYKTVPSAGALYPLELYICCGNVTGLDDGIYWYRPEGHKLIRVITGDQRKALCAATVGQRHFKNAAATIIIAADFKRTESKYGKRGTSRYVFMEAGHSAQNIYLQATTLNIGVCVVGAFNDSRVKNLIKMKEENPLYLIPLGKIETKKGK